jgi:2'-5' RNA ligase
MVAEKALYFVAIVPKGRILDELWRLKEQLAARYNAKAALKSPPHITLHMPFQFRKDREERVLHVLQEAAQSITPFMVELKNFNAFPPRVVYVDVVPNESLTRIQLEVHGAMKTHLNVFNPDYKNRGFTPHLTVLFRDLKKPEFTKAWDQLKGTPLAYTFEVTDLCLLQHNGRNWDIFERIPLKSAL